MLMNSDTMTGMDVSSAQNGSAGDASQLKFDTGSILWIRLRSHGRPFWPAQVVDEKFGGANKKGRESATLVRLYGTYEFLYVDHVKCCSEFEEFIKQENISSMELFQKVLEEDISRYISSHTPKRKTSKDTAKTSNSKRQKHGKSSMTGEADGPSSGKEAHAEETTGKNVKDKSRGASVVKKAKNDQGKELADKEQTTPRDSGINKGGTQKVTKKRDVNKNSTIKKQGISKQNHACKDSEMDTPHTVKPTAASGETNDVSARKRRVMQNLGLIAPEGSPFGRNGHAMTKLLNV